ncbi:MAG: SBBP repeat-containing protein [Chitinophagaceae bacterium]|jgi:hypothetical protein
MKKTLLSLGILCLTLQGYAQAPTCQWARNSGGSLSTNGQSVAVDLAGNVYTIGFFTGATDFNPGTGTTTLTSAGNEDIYISKLDASGNFVWAKSFGGKGADMGYSIYVDGGGNVYATGSFEDTSDFDPGSGIIKLSSAGGSDVFVLKLDASGNVIFANRAGGKGKDMGQSIYANSKGSFITGLFSDTADFDPAGSAPKLASKGETDVFILKFEIPGTYSWVKQIGGMYEDEAQAIATDSAGNVYTAGWFNGSVDFNPGAGDYYMASVAVRDGFLSKLDPSGNFTYAKIVGGKGFDGIQSISIDGNHNIYAIGYFSGYVDFNTGPGDFYLNSGASTGLFILKLDKTGNFLWAKSFNATLPSHGNLCATDVAGHLYLTAYFTGVMTIETPVGPLTSLGADDFFILKMSPSGKYTYAVNIGGKGYDNSFGIATDRSNNVFVTGNFAGAVDFDPGTTNTVLSSTISGGSDAFMVKYSNFPLTLKESSIQSNIRIYPNPASDILKVEIPDAGQNTSIEVINVLGVVMEEYKHAGAINSLDFNSFAPGIYFIKVKNGDEQLSVSKILKQ